MLAGCGAPRPSTFCEAGQEPTWFRERRLSALVPAASAAEACGHTEWHTTVSSCLVAPAAYSEGYRSAGKILAHKAALCCKSFVWRPQVPGGGGAGSGFELPHRSRSVRYLMELMQSFSTSWQRVRPNQKERGECRPSQEPHR